MSLQIPAGAAQNAANEDNSLSNLAAVIYDTPPVVTVGVTTASLTSVVFHLGFDQAWSLSDVTRLAVVGGNITAQAADGATPIPGYDVTVVPYGSGTLTLTVGAGTFVDGSSLPNAAVSKPVTVGASSTGSEARVTGLTFVSAVDRTYTTGQAVDLLVNFTRPVTVRGTPSLQLNATGTATVAAVASYQSASGAQLAFRYVVTDGNYSPSLDAVNSAALVLGANGGIVGDDAFLASTTLPAPGAAGSLSANGPVGINYTPPKPAVDSVAGPDSTDSCGAGSGIGLVLGAGALAFGARRRRH